MYWLFFQIWVWLLVAFVLGWLAHWFLCCRGKNEASSGTTAAAPVSAVVQSVDDDEPLSQTVAINDSWKPMGFASRPDDVDDLKRIKGVGAVIEETLNGLGIYQFRQIADWDADNAAWVENFISFPGRIARENWIEQSKTLAVGGTTEFAKRVDKGDVEYKKP